MATSEEISKVSDDYYKKLNAQLVDPMKTAQNAAITAQGQNLANTLAGYNNQGQAYGKQYQDNATQVYTQKMMAQKALPQQLAAGGIMGQGASESTIAGMNNQYMGNRNNLLMAYQDAMRSLDTQKNTAMRQNTSDIAGIENDYALRMLDAQRQNEQTAYQRGQDWNNEQWRNKEWDYNDMWRNKEWDYNDMWKNRDWDDRQSQDSISNDQFQKNLELQKQQYDDNLQFLKDQWYKDQQWKQMQWNRDT